MHFKLVGDYLRQAILDRILPITNENVKTPEQWQLPLRCHFRCLRIANPVDLGMSF